MKRHNQPQGVNEPTQDNNEMIRLPIPKRHTCTFCGKSFGEKSKLNVHIKSHTGIKDYVCPVCNKRESNVLIFLAFGANFFFEYSYRICSST